jgi:hypothetical protein
MSAVLLIEPLLTSVLAVRRDSMGTCRPSAGIHLLGLARRSGSCRSCRSEPVSPVSVPLGTDADCGPLVTLRPFAPPNFHRASTLLWPLLTPGSLSRARSPRVRTGTFDPCRQALPDPSFGDDWISRSLARSSPVSGLTACSCSCGRVLATPFFQLGLAASTLGFATLLVTLRGYLLSGNKYMPMSGTLGRAQDVPDMHLPSPEPVGQRGAFARPTRKLADALSPFNHPRRNVLLHGRDLSATGYPL